MATTQRLGRTGTDVTVHPVYEDFKPVTEWKREEETDTYLVYVPGFKKEQLKVTTDGHGGLKITGERLVGGTKRSRFRDEIRMPDNCVITEIHARFENGVLRITMPKKTQKLREKILAKIIPTSIVDKPPTPPKAQPMPQTVQQKAMPKADQEAPPKADEATPKAAARATPLEKQNDKSKIKATTESTIQKVAETKERLMGGLQTGLEKAKERTSGFVEEKFGKGKTQKVQEETPQKDETITQMVKEKIPPQVTSSIKVEKQRDEEGTSTILVERPTIQPTLENAFQKIDETRQKFRSGVQTTLPKKKERGDGNEVEKMEVNEKIVTASGNGGNTFEDYKKSIKDPAKELQKERKLMVNMGVAVLVILALGAHITYTFGSHRKAKH